MDIGRRKGAKLWKEVNLSEVVKLITVEAMKLNVGPGDILVLTPNNPSEEFYKHLQTVCSVIRGATGCLCMVGSRDVSLTVVKQGHKAPYRA
jgi:hypothetical protein